MFFPEGQLRVYLYGEPADMRRSFDGLSAMVRQKLSADPLDGGLYAFINRRGTQIRVLYFDRSGFCVWGKRLEAGRFISDWRAVQTRQMDFTGSERVNDFETAGTNSLTNKLGQIGDGLGSHAAATVSVQREGAGGNVLLVEGVGDELLGKLRIPVHRGQGFQGNKARYRPLKIF